MKMMFTKLKVFMLLAVCACGLGAKAEVTETIDFSKQGYADATNVTEVTSGGVTLVFDKSSGTNAPKYYNGGTAVRMYANNTLTVSVPADATLNSVAFTFVSSSYNMSDNYASTGTYVKEDNTWTAGLEKGNSVLFTNTTKNQWRIQKITVTYSEGATASVAAPEISLSTGDYVGEQTVAITAEDGASIYYTTDGETPTVESAVYTAPFTVSETTTVKAIAVKGGESSSVATSVITIVLEEVNSIAAFIEVGTKAALTLTNAVVTARNANSVYIQDATGALLIYGTVPDCSMGDKVSGTIIGEYSEYKDHAHQLLNGNFSGATFTAGGVMEPKEVTVAELNADPDAYHMLLVAVKGCTFANNVISQGEDAVKFYDSLKLMPSNFVWPTLFDFTGIFLNYYTTTPELIARSTEDIVNKSSSSLETPEFEWSATSVVYDLNAPVELPELTNTSDGAVTFTSSNEAVAVVDETGNVTVLAEGTTTITAKVAETETYSAASASYTLEVINTQVPEGGVAFVVSTTDGINYAMSTKSTIKSNAMDPIQVYTINGKIVNAENPEELSWLVDKEAGTIQTSSGKYLTAAASGTSLSTNTKKCVWTWDDTDGVFKLGTRSFFYQEGQGFKNYAVSNLTTKGYSSLSQMMTFADGHVRTGLTEEAWGTICLPNAVAEADVTGATFYPVAGKVVTDGKVSAIVLGEPATALEAGVPYVFTATDTRLLAAYTGEAVTSPVAVNGLNGTLAVVNADKNADDTELSGKYILVGGTWKLCGKGCSLAANRAYLDMEAVPSLEAGTYALTMSVFDDNVTAIESVDAASAASVDVYTVSGVRVRTSVSAAQATEGLQKGLYIINGKKTLVK